ncbi:uncharacterized protein LOC134232586 [Saccostrea cucullata]|uniref:uncharacterized protein LOC134232586 n=1 Tax=Saccostrea cuccullata TaxID=36930 RepID=UPI002ECFB723
MDTAFYSYTILVLLTATWTAHLADGKSPLIQKPITQQDERLVFVPQNKKVPTNVDQFEIPDDNHVAVPGKGIQYIPWWTTFLMDIIMNFYRQRINNRSQFGVLFMANIDNLKNFPLNFEPQNKNGDPVLDNRYPISPNNVADFGNYVSTRPENIEGTMIHAEKGILNNLNSLWDAYRSKYGQPPNFMLLYSWIMPCPNYTNMILSRFNLQPYSNVQYRVVAYTVEGTSSDLPYMTPQSNAQSRNNLKNSGITVYRQRCQRPNGTVSDMHTKLAQEISEDAYLEKTIESQIHVKDDPNTHMCGLEDTFQGCMVECLGDICCSCKNTGKRAMTIALVNELTKFCAVSDITTCPLEWMNTYFSRNQNSASSCTVFESVAAKVRACAATTCFGRPMSKPLDPTNPYNNPGYLINFSDLNTIPKVDLTDFCQDIRAESLLCTTYRADSFTAGNTRCRSDNRCGFNQGTSYSWCYVNFNGDWDYCCTGSCGFNEKTDYMWCRSGDRWQYCGNGGNITIGGQLCLAEFPCGMHQENGKASYYWCYTGTYWDYCCQPWDTCSTHGYEYNWCYTGYKKQTKYQYCTPP